MSLLQELQEKGNTVLTLSLLAAAVIITVIALSDAPALVKAGALAYVALP